MEERELNHKVTSATKWSALIQVTSKLITPITTIILARILVPEEFGIVVIITMIISFADMLTDAGFQKYLIQHEFTSYEEQINSTNVAFWTNLTISFSLWLLIILFKNHIAMALEIPELGYVLVIACVKLPITSFSGIQMALFIRNFEYKALFKMKVIGVIIPFVVTIPLAYLGFGYWSLIIGALFGALSDSIILTVFSKWKPFFYYKITLLKKMFSFSMWSLLDSITIWLTTWLDGLIVAAALSSYFLGIYKTSQSIVNSLMILITAMIYPILFSALSRLQNDDTRFSLFFLKIQKLLAYIVFPMGIGIYLYRDFLTYVALGEQWAEASNVIGIWGLASAMRIVFVSVYSEAYRAKGKFKLSFLLQILDLLILVPTCLISVKYGFWWLVFARAFVRLDLIIPGLIVMDRIIKVRANSILKNIINPFICVVIMMFFSMWIQDISTAIYWNVVSIVSSGLVYLISVFFIDRKRLMDIVKLIRKQNMN